MSRIFFCFFLLVGMGCSTTSPQSSDTSGSDVVPVDVSAEPDAAADVSVEPDVVADVAAPDMSPEPDASVEEDTGVSDAVDAGVVMSPTCEGYCAAMAATCSHEAFHPEESCMLWCDSTLAPLPPGSASDTNVDTIGCRMHWIGKAKDATGPAEKAEFCANANASGGDTCGSFCDVYCRQAVPVCTLENSDIDPEKIMEFGGDSPEADNAICMDLCADFSTDVLDGVSQTEQHFGYGDTVQCRLHHLQAAMIQGPEKPNAFGLHCGHGSPVPTELCLNDAKPNWINYCEFAIGFCPQLFEEGTDTIACRGIIEELVQAGSYFEGPFLSFTDKDSNTLGCLNYWIMKAPHNPGACGKGDYDPENWTINGGVGVCTPAGGAP